MMLMVVVVEGASDNTDATYMNRVAKVAHRVDGCAVLPTSGTPKFLTYSETGGPSLPDSIDRGWKIRDYGKLFLKFWNFHVFYS